MTMCRHCQAKEANRPRGLCWSCYYTPGLKERYPSTSKFSRRTFQREPTAAEVEALIAEQMKRLPPWWPKDGMTDGDD